MNPVASSTAATAQSIQAVNDMLKMMSQASVEQVEKMVQVQTEMKLASIPGMGEQVDLSA